ncbi:hypothetical protein HPULCUR_008718 [Helicostylum pulchrum]|uniref:EF-hand domain-containing protein n=1 Tax=Helicostylum pulchrum TaxID=562976 RepID=A0ABP9Y8E7_9FUNG
METRITYNKHTEEIFGWGDQLFGRNNKDYIHCDDFDDGLYSIFKKEKNKWDENDEFLIKAVSDYIRLAAKESIEASKIVTESNDAFHYAFIVPSEWEEEIREELIRPIFIRSDLISKEDHNDKLLFFSDIESISYGLKGKNFKKFLLPRGQNTILCRLVPTKFDTVSVELDLISTMNPLFDFPDSRLFPKVIRSKSISISVEDIKTSIKAFLKTKLSLDNDKIIDAMAEHIYKEELPDMDPRIISDKFLVFDEFSRIKHNTDDDDKCYMYGGNESDFYDEDDFYGESDLYEESDVYDDYDEDGEYKNDDTADEESDSVYREDNEINEENSCVDEEDNEVNEEDASVTGEEGNEADEEDTGLMKITMVNTIKCTTKLILNMKAILKSIRHFYVYSSIIEALYDHMKIEDQYSSGVELSSPLLKWLQYMLEYNRRSLNYITTMTKSDLSTEISRDNILLGAIEGVLETIQNAYMYCKPRILLAKKPDYALKFRKSKKNIITVGFHISLKYSLCSFSGKKNGRYMERLASDNFLKNGKSCITSLESFCADSNETILKEKIRFFADNFKKYLSNNVFKNSSDWERRDEIAISFNGICGCDALLTMNDIIDISIKPVLRSIASIVLTSRQLQKILTRILKEECDDFIQEQRIDTNYYHTFDTSHDGTISLKDIMAEHIGFSCVEPKNINTKAGAYLPVKISIVPNYYSSSIRFYANVVGAGTEKEHFIEMGESMTLCRS